MNIIYEPKGRAFEYSPLAVNLFNGCSHGCKYCYCPGIFRKKLDVWASNPRARANILDKLENDAKKMRGDKRDILFSFTSDPYQSVEAGNLTRDALLICEKNNLTCQVLTKGGMLASKDFDILKRNNWKFGSTIIFKSENLREKWEPNAPTIEARIKAVKLAHSMGIYTWVSIEPVVDAAEALNVMEELKCVVDFWKVGKINNYKLDVPINWHKFLLETERVLAGKKFYIKKDLEKYRND